MPRVRCEGLLATLPSPTQAGSTIHKVHVSWAILTIVISAPLSTRLKGKTSTNVKFGKRPCGHASATRGAPLLLGPTRQKLH